MGTDSPPRRTPPPAWLLVGYAAFGWAALWVPYRLAHAAQATRAGNPVDGLQVWSLGLLGAVGFLGGLLRPRVAAWWAMASLVAFPLIAVVEMARDPTSHNLWPLEFVMYAFLSSPAVAGAWLGGRLARRAGDPRD